MPGYKPRSSKKQIEILYTPGNVYMTLDGSEYIGYYYMLNGFAYVYDYDNVQKNTDIVLIDKIQDKNKFEYFLLNKKIPNKFVEPKKYYPIPNETDYENTYLNRYFVSNKSIGDIIEVDEEQYNNIATECLTGKKINGNIYEGFIIKWKISGPKQDRYNNTILIETGVENTNKNNIRLLDKKYPILKKVLKDYVEYWRGF